MTFSPSPLQAKAIQAIKDKVSAKTYRSTRDQNPEALIQGIGAFAGKQSCPVAVDGISCRLQLLRVSQIECSQSMPSGLHAFSTEVSAQPQHLCPVFDGIRFSALQNIGKHFAI